MGNSCVRTKYYDGSDDLVGSLSARAKSKAMDKELKADGDKQANDIKLLLLGAGECGKSTILKQMKIINMDGFSREDFEHYRNTVYSNTISSLASILQAMRSLGVEFGEADREHDSAIVYAKINRMVDTEPFENEVYLAMKRVSFECNSRLIISNILSRVYFFYSRDKQF